MGTTVGIATSVLTIRKRLPGMLKRAFDVVASLTGILLLSPLLLGIASLIKYEDGGPVFYRGVRSGRHGKPFQMLKFRTMVVNADRIGGASTADDDPRITRMGRWLRQHKLDEIPQLINVLRGHMSIVGPRPEVLRYTSLYTPEERRILETRPGITDWASIWNPDEGALLKGAPDPDKAYEELIRPTKLKLQLRYVNQHSFVSDLRIIFFTLLAMLKGRDFVIERVPELRV